MEIELREMAALGAELDPLVSEAAREGHLFMRRLRDDWETGANRFGGPGERLFAAFLDGQLVGVGGLNRDPYSSAERVGRLRHLYVAAEARRRGVGRRLVERIIAEAKASFSTLRLRTLSADAAAFYRGLGFVETVEEAATHVMRIG